LLSAELSEDEGYFKERLAKGRAELVRVWHERSATLKPQFPHTDLLGAMLVAAHYFGESPEKDRKLLVIFPICGDQLAFSTSNTRFLRRRMLCGRQPSRDSWLICAVWRSMPWGRRERVSVVYWQNLRVFWTANFKDAGARLEGYSILRDEPG